MNAFWQQLASATQVDHTIRPRLPGRFETPAAVDSESESPVEEVVPVVSRPPSTTTIEVREVDKSAPQQPSSKEALRPSEPQAAAPSFKEENEVHQVPPDNLSVQQQSPLTSEKEQLPPPATPSPKTKRPADDQNPVSPRSEWPGVEEVIRGEPAPVRTITAEPVPTQRPPLFEAPPQVPNTEKLNSTEVDVEVQAVGTEPVTGELSPARHTEEFLKPLDRPQPAAPAAVTEKKSQPMDEPPVIEISIGRIVLRPEALPEPAQPRQRFQPQITLEGYLRERNGGSR